MTPTDLKDFDGNIRARYIGCDDGPHTWLVYGDDLDTAGAITRSQIATKGTKFRAFRHGRHLGDRSAMANAVSLVLHAARVLR